MTVVASGYERKHLDLYETEEWVTEAIIRNFSVRGLSVWEPAAGRHKMADVFREHGAQVFTSDIVTYDRPHDIEFDFLSDQPAPALFDAVLTNPPYGAGNRDAAKFARRALERCPGTIALLLTAKFDSGKSRRDLFADNPRFAAKIVLLDRIQWFPGASTGTEDHAVYVWTAAPLIRREPVILYEEKPKPKKEDNRVSDRP